MPQILRFGLLDVTLPLFYTSAVAFGSSNLNLTVQLSISFLSFAQFACGSRRYGFNVLIGRLIHDGLNLTTVAKWKTTTRQLGLLGCL